MPEYANFNIVEFTDDGFSGSTFERPAIKNLLEMAYNRQISAVFVKDTSRFSRDLLQSGYYIEKVFPELNIRFLSVVDEFDSNNINDMGINISFKHLLSEYYIKDLSTKSKQAKYAKMKRGEYFSKNSIYGYYKGDDNVYHIDENVSNNVKTIFEMTLQGFDSGQIRNNFHENKILTPAEYKASQGRNYYHTQKQTFLWNRSMIYAILNDERYTGTYISGKEEVIKIGQKACRKIDESKWHKIENHCPVIIDKELFTQVQEVKNSKKINRQNKSIQNKITNKAKNIKPETFGDKNKKYMFKNKVFCGECGALLTRLPRGNVYFSCYRSKGVESLPCYDLKINEDVLKLKVFEILQNYAKAYIEKHQYDCKKEVPNITKEFKPKTTESLQQVKRELYENLIKKEIDAVSYKGKIEEINIEIANFERSYKKNMIENHDLKTSEFNTVINDVLNSGEVTEIMVDLLVEKVLILPNHKVLIEFKNI